MNQGTISGLRIYPIKSFGGVELATTGVERRGLRFDRRWMLVDSEGMFLTQRSDTRLALFRIKIDDDGLILSHPGTGTRHVPYKPTGERRSVQVWKSVCEGVQVSAELDEWFADLLNQQCSLVYMPDDSLRETSREFTQEGDIVGFADAFPILVLGESSMAGLNEKLEMPLPVNRFRPNIIVSGWEPHAEDGWARLQVSDVSLRFAKKCGRCSVTATDQDTGEVGVEPLKTLATYRKDGFNVMFGAYYVPEREGPISVGHSIQGIA
ncbi:MAG: MOSC domain-containing protein [Fimbriimonas sp.]|nr:MOSC domain-containing protein [Fimbriimonas sp.]